MSVSAREKVFGIRYAQSQVKRLRREIQQECLATYFPINRKATGTMTTMNYASSRNSTCVGLCSNRNRSLNKSLEAKIHQPMSMDFDKENQLIAMEERALMARFSAEDNKRFLRKFASTKFKSRRFDEDNAESVSGSVSAATSRSTLAEFPMHLFEQYVPTSRYPAYKKRSTSNKRARMSGTHTPVSIAPPTTPSTRKGLLYINTLNRMKLHESTEGSPVISAAPSVQLPSAEASKSILVTRAPADTGAGESESQTSSSKKVMWADQNGNDEVEVVEVASTTTSHGTEASSQSHYNYPPLPFPLSKGPGSEFLCISSMVNDRKGPESWINRRFPEIAQDLREIQKQRRAKLHIENRDTLPSRNVQHPKFLKNVPRPSSPDALLKDQPLPHKRGLIGFEISQFEPECAFFFRSSSGILNPHLNPHSTRRFTPQTLGMV